MARQQHTGPLGCNCCSYCHKVFVSQAMFRAKRTIMRKKLPFSTFPWMCSMKLLCIFRGEYLRKCLSAASGTRRVQIAAYSHNGADSESPAEHRDHTGGCLMQRGEKTQCCWCHGADYWMNSCDCEIQHQTQTRAAFPLTARKGEPLQILPSLLMHLPVSPFCCAIPFLSMWWRSLSPWAMLP